MSVLKRTYSRASWGARYRAGFGDRSANYPLPYAWTHHSVTAHLSENATVAQEKAQMRILENIGQQRFGGGISYTFIIFPSGRIYMGTGASRRGAHTGGFNTLGIGVCFAGNYENAKPTKAAEETYAGLLKELASIGVLRNARTNGGHRDAPGHSWNACPGRHLHARLGAINTLAAGGTPASSSGSSSSSKSSSTSSKSSSSKGSSYGGNSSKGTGVTGRFLEVTSRNSANIRSNPDSRTDRNIVGKVGRGHLVRRDRTRDTRHFYGVGDRWYIGKSVSKPVSAPSSATLVVGDWPGRRLPVNGVNTFELNMAWRELLARIGIKKGSRTAMVQRWLSSRGYNPGPHDGIAGKRTYRALQSYLRDQGLRPGAVDGIRGNATRQAEKRFLNSQIAHLKSKWPQHYRAKGR